MKRESVRRIGFFCNYRSRLPLSTHQPVTTKNTGKYDSIGDKKKRVKSDSYLTYGQSRKTYGIIRRYPPPHKKNTNKFHLFYENVTWDGNIKKKIRTIYNLLSLSCS